MPYIKIEKLGDTGLNTDDSIFNLSPSTWSDGNNVNFYENSIYRALGYQSSSVLGTPSAIPFFIFKGKDGVNVSDFIIYAGLNNVYSIIGDVNTHNIITRTAAGVDVLYSASINNAWQAGIINGITVLNNGTDIPQKWIQASSTQRLINLDGWTATWKASVIRPYKNFLIAVDITKGALKFPQMVKWSTSASSGNVPLSWDEADATNDAGEFNLAETPDICIDELVLRDVNIIYKENTTWGMRFIGFPFIFQFYRIFTEFGVIAKNCVAEFKDKHIVLTEDDVIIHDGQIFDSLVNNKIRKGIFNSIDPSSKANCFVFYDKSKGELYIGIPDNLSYPDVLWIWNSRYNTWGKRSVPGVNSIAIDFGVKETAVWDTDTQFWDSDLSVWNVGAVASGKLIMVSSSNNKLFQLNSGTTADGSSYSSFIQKDGVAWSDQSFTQDNVSLKLLSSMRPEFSASSSVQINISVGTRFRPTDTVVFSQAIPFNPSTDEIVYFNAVGRYFDYKFETTMGGTWELKSLVLDIRPMGLYA